MLPRSLKTPQPHTLDLGMGSSQHCDLPIVHLTFCQSIPNHCGSINECDDDWYPQFAQYGMGPEGSRLNQVFKRNVRSADRPALCTNAARRRATTPKQKCLCKGRRSADLPVGDSQKHNGTVEKTLQAIHSSPSPSPSSAPDSCAGSWSPASTSEAAAAVTEVEDVGGRRAGNRCKIGARQRTSGKTD